MSTADSYIEQYVVRDVLDGTGAWRWTGADPEFQFRLKGTHRRKLAARIVIVGDTLRQNGPKEITWFVNAHELARRYERQGESRLFRRPRIMALYRGTGNRWHAHPPTVRRGGRR